MDGDNKATKFIPLGMVEIKNGRVVNLINLSWLVYPILTARRVRRISQFPRIILNETLQET